MHTLLLWDELLREEAVMVVEMREFGRSLVTRTSGKVVYEKIVPVVMDATDVVVFDFDGVDTITNSFADEVFGHMVFDIGIDELRKRTRFRGITPFLAQVVRYAMDLRESQREIPAVC